MEQKKFKKCLLLSACVIGIYFLFERASLVFGFLKTLWLILTPFVLGGTFAFILNQPLHLFENKLLRVLDKSKLGRRMKRPLAMLLVIALVFSLIYLLLSMIIPELIKTLVAIVEGFPGFLGRVDQLLKPYGIELYDSISNALVLPSVATINTQLGDMFNLLLKGAAFSGTLIGSVYQNVLSLFFTVMFTIYFLATKERLSSQSKRVLAAYLKTEHYAKLLRVVTLVKRTFSSFISGQCLEALILGSLFFVSMTVFRMPYVLLVSVFITATALIPVIGAWLGCIVGAVLMLMTDPMQAVWFLLLFLVLQQIEGNLIYPRVMGNAIGLPSIWVLFAVVLGEGLMGVLGMLLFIPLTSVGYALFREQVNQRLKEREAIEELEKEKAIKTNESSC